MKKSDSHFAHMKMSLSSRKLQLCEDFSLWKQEPEDAFLWCPQVSLSLGKNEFDDKEAD